MSIAADAEIICALSVLPAKGDEAKHARDLMEAAEAAQGNDVHSLWMDSIGFQAAVLRELQSAEQGPRLEVVVPPDTHESNQPELFQSSDFQRNQTKDEVTCPGGETRRRKYRAAHDQCWQFNFRTAQWANCALRAQCLKPEQKSGPMVSKNADEAEYGAARARAATDQYQEVRKQHRRIERKLSDLIRWHGGRRVGYRGRARVRIQYLLTAVVVNGKRLVKLIAQCRAVQPPERGRACVAGAEEVRAIETFSAISFSAR